MPENGRTVRGLSIAITILAALSLVAALVLGAMSSFLAIGLASSDYSYGSPSGYSRGIGIDDLDLSPSDIKELRELGVDVDNFRISEDDAMAIATITTVALVFASLLGFASAAVSLVVGILGILRWRRPDRMQAVFVWAIIAAVLALAVGRIISLVLLIILAVEAYKYRKDYERMAADPAFAQQRSA